MMNDEINMVNELMDSIARYAVEPLDDELMDLEDYSDILEKLSLEDREKALLQLRLQVAKEIMDELEVIRKKILVLDGCCVCLASLYSFETAYEKIESYLKQD